jgi:serine/threonine protein kinase
MGCVDSKNAGSVSDGNVSTKSHLERYYNMESTIGYGHFAVVKKGRDLNGDQLYHAIKCIAKSELRHEMHLLRRELRIVKRIKHDNIVQFHEVHEDSEYFYIAMEY